jgi:hypothetical protein
MATDLLRRKCRWESQEGHQSHKLAGAFFLLDYTVRENALLAFHLRGNFNPFTQGDRRTNARHSGMPEI